MIARENELNDALEAVRKITDRRPRLALILGSGLGSLADSTEGATVIESNNIPGYPSSTVQGHRGRLVFGTMAGCEVLFVQGRVHAYEGHDLAAITFPVRLAHALGATHMLVTNAAGGINQRFPPGTLMWITGHIDWTGPKPYVHGAIEADPYDADWLAVADAAVAAAGVGVERGVYLWTSGPSYETKAEIRAFRGLGASAVGMSTVPEVRAAAELGMRVLGLSTITNPAAGLNTEPLGHGEVVEMGERMRGTLEKLVGIVASGLPNDLDVRSSGPSIQLVRPEVRRAREYAVGAPPGGGSAPVAKLNQNECPLDLPAEVKADICRAVDETEVNRYPSEVPHELRAALAERYGHPEAGIIVGNGSNELTYTLGMTFVGPGTPVVLPRPMFALFESMVGLHGGAVVPVAPLPDLSFDMDGVLAAMARTNPTLTVLTTPNNPTGLALTRDQIVDVLMAAPGIVVVDEAYVEFNPHGTVLDLADRFPNLIIMRTLSKAFGLAGLRVGYMLGHPRLVAEMMKSRLPFMVDRIAEAAALSLLRRPEIVAGRIGDITRWTADLTSEMSRLEHVQVIPSSTNFVLFRTNQDPHALTVSLAKLGILVREMGGYPDLKGWIRVSSGTEHENRLFLSALGTIIAGDPAKPETISEHPH